MTCQHFTPGQLARFAPVPCATCGGWVEANGNVIDRQATLERYPAMANVIGQSAMEPDVVLVQRRPGLLALVGSLMATLFGIALALAALGILAVVFVIVWRG